MKKVIIEYKAIAYFTKTIEIEDGDDISKAIEIADNLPKDEFELSATLDGSWEFNQAIPRLHA